MSILLWPIVCVAVWSAEQFRLQCTLECPQQRQRRDRRRQRIANLCRGNREGAIADGPVQRPWNMQRQWRCRSSICQIHCLVKENSLHGTCLRILHNSALAGNQTLASTSQHNTTPKGSLILKNNIPPIPQNRVAISQSTSIGWLFFRASRSRARV